MAEMGHIMKFFFRFKDERGEAERVDKVTRGEAECDKPHLKIKVRHNVLKSI